MDYSWMLTQIAEEKVEEEEHATHAEDKDGNEHRSDTEWHFFLQDGFRLFRQFFLSWSSSLQSDPSLLLPVHKHNHYHNGMD